MNSVIYQYYREAVGALRLEVIGKCSACSDGFIPITYSEKEGRIIYEHCSCKDEFNFKKKLLISNVPRGKWEKILDEKKKVIVTDPYDYNRKYSLYSRYIRKYLKNVGMVINESVGLFMFGPPGLGKTTAAYYIIGHAVKQGRSCYYIYFKDLISMLIKSYSDEALRPLFDAIIGVEILVIDELSLVGRVTPHAVAEFTSIIKNRVEKGSSTILISNYKDIDEIKNNFGETMESLMLEAFQGIRFFGKRDLREIKAERLQSFFK